ncbi:hypothetical protein ANN_21025 [Periplaneta americana]|uniref:Uncharacterized protein n=1 Tax=Periplaneta americana TaxID=6978 RepID=A0ABQ8SF32_PERAM|nr:hypothetical protein ANN_21025 [Periplaneta americana]
MTLVISVSDRLRWRGRCSAGGVRAGVGGSWSREAAGARSSGSLDPRSAAPPYPRDIVRDPLNLNGFWGPHAKLLTRHPPPQNVPPVIGHIGVDKCPTLLSPDRVRMLCHASWSLCLGSSQMLRFADSGLFLAFRADVALMSPPVVGMDSLERLMPALAAAGSSSSIRTRSRSRAGGSGPSTALVPAGRGPSASVVTASAIGRKGRHLTGTFCLTGDTMEGIIQCLVFLKAFSRIPGGAWLDSNSVVGPVPQLIIGNIGLGLNVVPSFEHLFPSQVPDYRNTEEQKLGIFIRVFMCIAPVSVLQEVYIEEWDEGEDADDKCPPLWWEYFACVEKFKYLGATVTNVNDTREEIKHRINVGNACYYSVEKLLSSSLLSKNLKVRIYKTVILPVVLYGCETWILNLREEHRLRVFESKVLRKIFGAKRDEVTEEWRKLHNTELNALYSSPDIIRNIKSRRLRWAEHVARMGESRNADGVLVGRPEGKRPLGRPRRRWEDNIKMDLREVGYDDREWINLAQDRDQWRAYVRAAMNLRVP